MTYRTRFVIAVGVVLLVGGGIAFAEGQRMEAKHRTDWFRDAGWGVFTHYLTGDNVTPEQWNRQINSFDVNALAAQLASVGARYYFITLGQNSGHYCSPNATYDSYVGIQPSKCSRRDLVADLYDALHRKGIKLLVYLPSGAPDRDPVAIKALQWQRGPHRNREFQIKWENVIREWSLRWGGKVAGWWFDGCYDPAAMYWVPDPPNFRTLADAARAGNPDAILAFNPGIAISAQSLFEDYTAGEINDPLAVRYPGRWVMGEQWHMLSYLGPWWSQGPPRFTNEQVVEMTRRNTAAGGVVTWDVPISPTGVIPDAFIAQLKALSAAMK